MIKHAKTKDEWDRCYMYLEGKGTHPLPTTDLFFVEKDGIVACAGWNRETGNLIEPMQSDDNVAGYKLFYFMQGLIKGLGFQFIRAITQNEKAIGILIKDGFTQWSPFINEYIREL